MRGQISLAVIGCWLAACTGTIEGGAAPVRDAPAGSDAPAPSARFGFVRTWGKLGSGNGEFRFPIGAAVGTGDVVHVTDFQNARVQRFDTDGNFLSAFATEPYPSGIAIDRTNGEIFVTHFGRFNPGETSVGDKVCVYDAAGTKLRSWGGTGSGDGELLFPGGIALAADGRVYVADEQNHRIQVFTKQGALLNKWGSYGPAPGQFAGPGPEASRTSGPNFLVLDGNGDVYTTEGGAGRIQRFAATGAPLAAWGTFEDVAGQFGGGSQGLGPISIAIDGGGRLWVAAASGRVQQFTRDGTYLQGFGSIGTEAGQFRAPHGLAFDSRGALYVVDGVNHRVQKFAAMP